MLNVLYNFVEQQVEELVCVLVHGRPEHLIVSPQYLQKLVWADYAYARPVCYYSFEYVF